MAVEFINSAEVADKTKGARVTIVNITASWCGPCKMMAPILEEIEAAGTPVFKVDVDENQEFAKGLEVKGVPTTLIYKDGKIVNRVEGFVPKQVLETKI